jgi:predicted DNA-binding protein (MmcQ/YjbR family)
LTKLGARAVPVSILAKLRAICLKLPGASEEAAWVGTRWVVRKRNFAHVVRIDEGWPPAYAKAAGSDGPLVVLTFRASDMLRDALRDAGPRFFIPACGTRWGTKVVGIKLDRNTDWKEVKTLIAESHRLLAPAPKGRRAVR